MCPQKEEKEKIRPPPPPQKKYQKTPRNNKNKPKTNKQVVFSFRKSLFVYSKGMLVFPTKLLLFPASLPPSNMRFLRNALAVRQQKSCGRKKKWVFRMKKEGKRGVPSFCPCFAVYREGGRGQYSTHPPRRVYITIYKDVRLPTGQVRHDDRIDIHNL